MIKGILFDFDGTVGNTTNLILTSFRYATQKVMGKVFPDEVYTSSFGLPLPQCMERIADSPEQVDELRTAYRSSNAILHDKLIEGFPGVKEAFAALAELGIKIAIVTSKKQPMCRRGLRCLELEEYVTAVVGCDNIVNSKPHGEPMEKGAAGLGLKPEECLCVGDSYFDLQSGHNANCAACVAVSYTCLDKNRVINEGKPDYIIDDLRELVPLVKKLNENTEV
ncbi:MAG: HAD hydrolase-like protein [Phascolarctobacterium sp.]|nr:HAD hydrolase-like protein [Phascolarctobacterium sp.]